MVECARTTRTNRDRRNLHGLISATEIQALLRGWRAGKPSAIRRIEKILTAANRNLAAALAYAKSNEIDRIERLDRLITLAEAPNFLNETRYLNARGSSGSKSKRRC